MGNQNPYIEEHKFRGYLGKAIFTR